MSDTSDGPGWWQATDGKWYPPQLRPEAPLPPPPAAVTEEPFTPYPYKPGYKNAAEPTARQNHGPASGETISIADELQKLAHLRDQGVLTEEEFQEQKARLLRSTVPVDSSAQDGDLVAQYSRPGPMSVQHGGQKTFQVSSGSEALSTKDEDLRHWFFETIAPYNRQLLVASQRLGLNRMSNNSAGIAESAAGLIALVDRIRTNVPSPADEEVEQRWHTLLESQRRSAEDLVHQETTGYDMTSKVQAMNATTAAIEETTACVVAFQQAVADRIPEVSSPVPPPPVVTPSTPTAGTQAGLLSFAHAQRIDGQRPIRGNLIIKNGVIGIGTINPKHGTVKLLNGAQIEVGTGIVKKSRAGKAVAFGVLALAARNTQNAAYVSIPVTGGSAAVYQVDGIAGEVLAAKLRTALAPLGVSVITT